MGIADAALKKTDYKKARDDYKKQYDKKKEEVKKTSIKIGLAQSAVQNAGIIGTGGGGGSYEPFQQGNTAFQFLQQSQQVCSGISNCPSTQQVQFTPYTTFGG
jgi:hypothetical protein